MIRFDLVDLNDVFDNSDLRSEEFTGATHTNSHTICGR